MVLSGYCWFCDIWANAQWQQTMLSAFTLRRYQGTNRNFHVTAAGAGYFAGDATFAGNILSTKSAGTIKAERLHIAIYFCMLAMDQMILLYFGQAAYFVLQYCRADASR